MEWAIGFLLVVLTASLAGLIIQSRRLNKIKIAGIKSEAIIKQAHRQADKTVREAKFRSEKDAKALLRRAEDDIEFKKRQLKETEQEVDRSKRQVQSAKRNVESLQDEYERKMESVKDIRKKQDCTAI